MPRVYLSWYHCTDCCIMGSTWSPITLVQKHTYRHTHTHTHTHIHTRGSSTRYYRLELLYHWLTGIGRPCVSVGWTKDRGDQRDRRTREAACWLRDGGQKMSRTRSGTLSYRFCSPPSVHILDFILWSIAASPTSNRMRKPLCLAFPRFLPRP